MLLAEIFPDIVTLMAAELQRLSRADLAAAVWSTSILDRRRCGDLACGTIHTQLSKIRQESANRANDLKLECGLNLTFEGGRIHVFETLDPAVTETLRRLFP
jgi:hypothetical protein